MALFERILSGKVLQVWFVQTPTNLQQAILQMPYLKTPIVLVTPLGVPMNNATDHCIPLRLDYW